MIGKPVIFISCGIFREELEYLADKRGLRGEIVFLDAALHVNFDRLKERLTAALEEKRKSGAELKVLYGYCHPEINGILEHYNAEKIDAGNCLEALAGAAEIRRLNAEAKTFFLSAGWVNHWEEMFKQGAKDLDLDFHTLFSGYRRAVVFETGLIPIDEEKLGKFSRFTGLPVERRTISLEHFESLLDRLSS